MVKGIFCLIKIQTAGLSFSDFGWIYMVLSKKVGKNNLYKLLFIAYQNA